MNAAATENLGQEFTISRVFDAPRDLVWKVFTEKDHLMQWWGPKGFVMKTGKIDLRQGGVFHYCLESTNGQVIWGRFVYREIVAPERFTFVLSFSDEQGGVARHPLAPTWPLETLNVATFEDQDGKTLITMRSHPINASDEERRTYEAGFDSMRGGYGGTWDKLDAYLAKLHAR